MKQFLRSFLFLSIIGSLASCNRDDDTPPPTATNLLTGKQWVITAWTVDPPLQGPNETFISDIFGFYQAQGAGCVLDDVRFFNANGTYTFEEGATKCNPSDPTIWEAGTWLFNSDETAIITTSNNVTPNGNMSTSYDIIELNATTLQYQYVERFRDQETGQVFSYTYTETHTAQ